MLTSLVLEVGLGNDPSAVRLQGEVEYHHKFKEELPVQAVVSHGVVCFIGSRDPLHQFCEFVA